MEITLIIIGIVIVTSLASYVYYHKWLKESEEFDKKKRSTTSYRSNEEFVESESKKNME